MGGRPMAKGTRTGAARARGWRLRALGKRHCTLRAGNCVLSAWPRSSRLARSARHLGLIYKWQESKAHPPASNPYTAVTGLSLTEKRFRSKFFAQRDSEGPDRGGAR